MSKLTAVVTLEILGRPAKNVTDALTSLVDKLSKEKGVSVLNKKIHEPKPVEESPDLFTSFAEIEVEFDGLPNYFGIVFAYMPSHIELIHPEKITLKNHDLNALANQVIQRLHGYDAIAKNMIVEKDILTKKLQEIAPHLFKEPEQPKLQTKINPKIKSKKSAKKKTTKKKKNKKKK